MKNNKPKLIVNSQKVLKCYYTNADSVFNKRAELVTAIAIHTPDVICITEAVPKNTRTKPQDSELQVEGYELFSNLERCKRGVLLYTADRLKAAQVTISNNFDFDENVWVEIRLQEGDKLLMGCLYRSPNSDEANNAKMLTHLKINCERKDYTHMVVCGDFNLPDINWVEGTTPDNVTNKGYLFMECIRDCFLTQHVKKYTHRRKDQTPTTIDLVLSNEEGMVDNLTMEAPLGESAHCSIIFDIISYIDRNEPSVRKPNYNTGDYNNFREWMGAYNWENDLQNLTCEESWTLFEERIRKGTQNFIPLKKVNCMKKPGRPLWMNTKALTKVKNKNDSYKRYIQTREGEDYLKYAQARNQAKWECRKAKRDFEKKLAKESKSNPKAFYKYVNSKLKTKSGIGNLDKPDGGKATTDKEKAESLNQFFTSVFTREKEGIVPDYTPNAEIKFPLEEVDVSEDKVRRKLDKLNPSKSPGPDQMHPRVLKELGPVISKPMAIIMSKSLEEGVLPACWKEAHVTPIFKKGNKSDTGNYRPVSLTSIVCKTLESIVREHLMGYIEKNKLLSSNQHGFTSGRSCSTQLLYCLDTWTRWLDEGMCLDAIYLDFAKAFDSVPHQRLLSKLKGYGFTEKLLKWSAGFLTGRRQKVVVNGQESEWSEVLSSVPQGSVLGPLFFILFINDMPEVVYNLIALFADDAKLFAIVESNDQHERLQDDLINLQEWANKWQLNFNAKKCKVMHLGRSNHLYEYGMGEVTLESITEEKDLGVWVDNKLSFNSHMEKQVNKANRQLGLIRRSFDFLDKDTFNTLYKSLVRTHLEYCNVVAYPQTEKQWKMLEGVQRRATRMVPELREMGYVERMKALGLPSMRYRRARGDLIEAYKYLHGINRVSPCPLKLDECTINTRGHSMKLRKPSCNLSTRLKFFTYRVVDEWNKLPEEIVTAPTINSFKNRLDKLWRNYAYSLEKF